MLTEGMAVITNIITANRDSITPCTIRDLLKMVQVWLHQVSKSPENAIENPFVKNIPLQT